jgi:hypothetical protein
MSTNNDIVINGRADSYAALAFVQEHADEYVDGALDAGVARLVEHYGRKYPECAQEIEVARMVRDGLRSIEAPPCPESVVTSVFSRISMSRRNAVRKAISEKFVLLQPMWRPVLALGAVVVVVLAILVREPVSQEYSQAEIDQALREVKWTLAYLGDVGKRTGETIRDDVLAAHVVLPINETVRSTLE